MANDVDEKLKRKRSFTDKDYQKIEEIFKTYFDGVKKETYDKIKNWCAEKIALLGSLTITLITAVFLYFTLLRDSIHDLKIELNECRMKNEFYSNIINVDTKIKEIKKAK